MTTIGEFIDYIEKIAPLHLQEPYDNSGLLYGDKSWGIRGILCCLDATEEILREAHARKCNLVVSHHPIIFKGLKKINHNHYVDKSIIYAIKNDIAIYAIHTNLDNILVKGVNEKIAKRLNISNLKFLAPKPDRDDAGTGVIGYLPEPMPVDAFLEYVKKQIQTDCIRHTPRISRPVHKVAVTGGSGAYWIQNAISAGADAYITADIKYHDFFEANGEILLCDVGHFESEQFTIDLLAELISENFRNFAAHCANLNTNPIQYF